MLLGPLGLAPLAGANALSPVVAVWPYQQGQTRVLGRAR